MQILLLGNQTIRPKNSMSGVHNTFGCCTNDVAINGSIIVGNGAAAFAELSDVFIGFGTQWCFP